jgi:hypothetical protein
MTDAKLGEERIDRFNLYSSATAAISQIRGADVIVTVRDQ